MALGISLSGIPCRAWHCLAPLSVIRCRAWHCLAMLGIGSPCLALIGIELNARALNLLVMLDTGWLCSPYGDHDLHW